MSKADLLGNPKKKKEGIFLKECGKKGNQARFFGQPKKIFFLIIAQSYELNAIYWVKKSDNKKMTSLISY